MSQIFLLNSHVFELILKDSITGRPINSATCTLTLKSGASTVEGQTFPLTLSYASATDGIYRGTLESDLVLVAGTEYTAHVEADAGDGKIGHMELPLTAANRTS